MSELPSKFDGVDRAAIFLLSLGENEAAEILKHMGPKEVQRVGMAMSSLHNITRVDVATVVSYFLAEAESFTALGVGSDDYIRSVLVNALGEDKANGVIDRILMGGKTKGLETLKWMEPRGIAEIIRLEHPQIISIILAYLEPDQAAEVLAFFPERVKTDIMMRIASLDGIPPSALTELNAIMESQFSGANTNIKTSSVGGVKTAANILNNMEGASESDILEKIKEVDSDLGQAIQDNMFVFENLIEIDDKGIQLLLREISSETLLVALKAAPDPLKEKIFNNMSKRASEMLRDDMEVRGAVKLSEVETAQKEVLAIARRMADAGEITLGGKGEEYVE